MGEDGDRKAVCGETASFLCWAWRCLYAAVIYARTNNKQLNTREAVWKTMRMASSRVKAHGAKWRKWFNTQRLWRESKRKMFPHQYQENILIHFDAEAEYTISEGLRIIFKDVLPTRFWHVRHEHVKRRGIHERTDGVRGGWGLGGHWGTGGGMCMCVRYCKFRTPHETPPLAPHRTRTSVLSL